MNKVWWHEMRESKRNSPNLFWHWGIFLGGLAICFFLVKNATWAGILTPSSVPGASGFSLDDIWNRLSVNATSSESGHSLSTVSSPAPTFHNLTDIYNAIPTIDPNKVLASTTYLGVTGVIAVNGSGSTITPSTSNQQIVAGYWSSPITVSGDTNLIGGNIKKDVSIFGITGTLPVYTYGDNSAANVLTTATGAAGTFNVSNLTNSLIKQGVTWGAGLDQTGTLVPSGGTAATGDVLNGKTFFGNSQVNWTLQSGTMTNNGVFSLIASSTDQDVTSGYYSGGILAGSANLTAGNIKKDINIFGVIGTLSAYTYGDNSAANVLTTATGVAGTYLASELNTGTVKNGTAFGVSSTGVYPSVDYPLPNAVPAIDLVATAGNIDSANGSVEWYKSDGTRQTATLDFPSLSNVCSTDTSNNIAGTLTLDAASIGAGNTICGVGGTLLQNEYNGSAGDTTLDYTFYALNNFASLMPNNTELGFFGGIDDYNKGKTNLGLGVMPAGSYIGAGWSASCTIDNHYCGVGDTAVSADKKDLNTGLIWSKWMDSGNSHTWFWANNCYEPLTAENLVTCENTGDNGCQCVKKPSGSKVGCESLDSTGGNTLGPWRTPTQKELMQAYIDGSWGNLSSTGYYFWSSTTYSDQTHRGWSAEFRSGFATVGAKLTAGYKVRCVK